jgi:hypothetical protein
MALISAQQDFRDTSLKSVSGGLNKLQYLADLRDTGDSTYFHWGLARTHGEQAASRALAEEHRQLVSTLLATPLRKLLEDVKNCSETLGVTPQSFIERLRARQIASLLPPDPDAGSATHLSSVLRALSALAQSQLASTHPA